MIFLVDRAPPRRLNSGHCLACLGLHWLNAVVSAMAESLCLPRQQNPLIVAA